VNRKIRGRQENKTRENKRRPKTEMGKHFKWYITFIHISVGTRTVFLIIQ